MENVEHQIIDLLKKGDKASIALIYDHYSANLYGVILRMLKDESDAKDALQESMIKIWQKGSSFDPGKARLFTWLLRICRNTAIDKLRVQQRRQEREIQISESNVNTLKSPDRIIPDNIDLNDHLDKLDIKYREVIRALFFGGMSQQEASEFLEIPLGTVKTRLRIGLREMKKIYVEVLIFLISVTLLCL